MGLELLDIDHAIVRVAALEAAVERYRSFGFKVAPERKKTGIATTLPDGEVPRKAPFSARHILFQPYPGRTDIANFVVLQCIQDQLNVPVSIAQVMSFMLDSVGPKAIICWSKDLEATKQALEEAGIETAPPRWTVEDAWEDDGQQLPVRSQPLITQTRRMPFAVNAFQTETLETFHHAPFTQHPNGARYMAGLTGVSENLLDDVAFMAERVFGVKPEWQSEEVAIVRPRDLFLRIVSPAGFAQLYPGLDFSVERVLPALCGISFAVASLDTLRATLRTAGVEHVETPSGAVVIPRGQAENTMLEFVAAA
jgi:hypothetical protein